MKGLLLLFLPLVLSLREAPTKPKLLKDFSATLKISENGVTASTSTVAISQSMMAVKSDQLEQPFDKLITQSFLCQKKQHLLIEPFFDEKVCYNFELPASEEPSQCFEAYANQVLANTAMYEEPTTEYAGRKLVEGKEATMWSYKENRVDHGHIVQNGTTYNVTIVTNNTYTFAVTEKGELLEYVQAIREDESGFPPDPSKHHIVKQDLNYLYSDYKSPCPASAFDPPAGVTCSVTEWLYNTRPSFLRKFKIRQPVMRSTELDLYHMRVNDKEYIDYLRKEASFQVGESAYMAGKTYAEVQKALGAFMLPVQRLPPRPHEWNEEQLKAIPATFDARDKWKQCPSIGKIRNQGGCGSCWAFGAVETLEDRYCINGEKLDTILSAEFIVDCDKHDSGCGGGFLDNAWAFLKETGIPSETCSPYQHCAYPPAANCIKPGPSPSPPPAPKPASCTACSTGAAIKKMYKAKTAYAVAKPGDVTALQMEIMEKGPIEVAFFVFSDFMQYKGGVYKKTPNAGMLGGHAVKIVGWGTENNEPYWLVANSWSPSWGLDGYFKILRGNNECGIETTPAAGAPDLS